MAFKKYLLFVAVVAINILGYSGYESVVDNKYVQDLYNIYTHKPVLPADMILSKVDPEDVNMYLFTIDNPQEFVRLDKQRPSEKLRGHETIVFLIHGWLENRKVQWYEDLKNAFLYSKQDNYKVVQVDWDKISHQLYSNSAYKTKEIGQILGEFIVNLNSTLNISHEQILLVGHSLGGQVSGFTGKTVYRLTKATLPRIVALDAAGPLFANRPIEERLNPTDAKVVHAIHTDGGTFGMKEACGTIDFYPNAGSFQPGCLAIDLTDPMTVPDLVTCNHQRSWMYFIEAVADPRSFIAKRCENWLEFKAGLCERFEAAMGDMKTTARGKFYLETNRKSPYSKPSKRSPFGYNSIPIEGL